MKNKITIVFLQLFLVLALDSNNASARGAASLVPDTSAAGCIALKDWQVAGHGTLDIKIDPWEEKDAIVPGQNSWVVRFSLTRDGKTYQGEITPPYYDPAAITIEDEDFPDWTQVCLDHVFVVNTPAERGGHLIVANQYQDKLIMTQYPYSSGDEDTALVRFINGAINVGNSASPDAPGWNLVEETNSESPTPHAYVAEAVNCETEDKMGYTFVHMPIDAAGKVYALEYLSVMPGGTSCTVSAARNDALEDPYLRTVWSDEGSHTNIVWPSDEEYLSTVIITHKGDLYTVDAKRALNSLFCGQSSQLANIITLRRGNPACEHVQWPGED